MWKRVTGIKSSGGGGYTEISVERILSLALNPAWVRFPVPSIIFVIVYLAFLKCTVHNSANTQHGYVFTAFISETSHLTR